MLGRRRPNIGPTFGMLFTMLYILVNFQRAIFTHLKTELSSFERGKKVLFVRYGTA